MAKPTTDPFYLVKDDIQSSVRSCRELAFTGSVELVFAGSLLIAKGHVVSCCAVGKGAGPVCALAAAQQIQPRSQALGGRN